MHQTKVFSINSAEPFGTAEELTNEISMDL